MANLNSVALTGNLTRDIELKTTANGTQVANATIAVNGFKEGDTSFIDLVLFGKTAEVAVKYTGKGQQLGVSGRLQQRSWEAKDGTKRSVTEVVVDNLQLPPKGDAAPQASSGDVVLEDIDDKSIDLSAIPF